MISPLPLYSRQQRAIVVAGGIGAVVLAGLATYKPFYALLAVVACFLVALTLTSLVFGVATLTLLSFFERLPGLSSLTLSKPFGLLLVASWLAAVARERGRIPLLHRDRPGLAYLLVALVVWGGVSVAWAADASFALTSAIRLALVAIFFFVVYSAIQTFRDVLVVAWAFLAGAFLVAFAALVSGQKAGGGRLTGGILDPNYLGAVLACSAVIAGFLFVVSRKPARVLLVLFIATDVVALVRTESRGGLIAMAVALVAGCAVAGPIRTQAIALVAITVAAAIGYYALAAPASLRERITNVNAQGSAGRSDTWQIAFHIGVTHPLGGVGLGSFRTVEASYLSGNADILTAKQELALRSVVHNTYLELFSELGGIGLLLFLAIVAVTLFAAARGIRLLSGPRSRLSLLPRGLVAGAVGLLAAYIFLSGEYQKELWVLLGLLATIPTAARSVLVSPRPWGVRAE